MRNDDGFGSASGAGGVDDVSRLEWPERLPTLCIDGV
jgi:hypothetical protein